MVDYGHNTLIVMIPNFVVSLTPLKSFTFGPTLQESLGIIVENSIIIGFRKDL